MRGKRRVDRRRKEGGRDRGNGGKGLFGDILPSAPSAFTFVLVKFPQNSHLTGNINTALGSKKRS